MALSEHERNRELDRRVDDLLRKSTAVKPPHPPMTEGQAKGMRAFAAKMLDIITPDLRAKLDNGSKLMQQRMKQRGIAPPVVAGGLFQ